MAALHVLLDSQTVFSICIFQFLTCIFDLRAIFNLAGGKMTGRTCDYRMEGLPSAAAIEQSSLASQTFPAMVAGMRSLGPFAPVASLVSDGH